MNADQEATRSLWLADVPLPRAAPLPASTTADVVVVGGGIAGLSAAYEFAREGRSVVVLERGSFGGGMTARTTAHLASALDDYYHELIRLRGEAVAAAWHRGQEAAIDRIEEIANREGMSCDFRRVDGYLLLAGEDDPALLDREVEACRKIGFHGVDRLDGPPFAWGKDRPCLRFRRQARFHALRYVDGLVAALHRLGVRLFGETAVTDVAEDDNGVVVRCGGGVEVRAAAAFVATNGPINDRLTLHAKEAPYRTYAVAFEVAPDAWPDVLAWDTLDAYHYVRLQERPGGGMALIVGGEDHKTGHGDFDHSFAALRDWTARRCLKRAVRSPAGRVR